MKVTSLLLVIGTSVSTLVAETVPNLNVEPSCKGATAIQIADSQGYDACIKDENTARNELLRSWQAFRPADRANCTSEASSQGLQSYVELLVCLQMAQQVEPHNQTKLTGARKR
jgi:hypothetical protein